MNTEITIVSGLPRSGTSVMMQMLDNGGMEVVTDHVRTADTDNPRGYYEFEIVKKIKTDATWLPATRGKAFKMVSQLLYDLPASETYSIVFMERNLEEVLVSQEKMLKRLNRPVAPHDQIMKAYALHLERLHQWLQQQKNIKILCVSYNDLMEKPQGQAERVCDFLHGKPSVEGMVTAVDPSLYRNRKTHGDRPNEPTLGSSP
jgi:uncharacterized coiled-coil protein SlyX